MDYKELKCLSYMLQNYRENLYKSVCERNDIVIQLEKLPIVFIEDGNTCSNIAVVSNHINQIMVTKTAELLNQNSILLRCRNLNQLIYCIKSFDILNIDKDLLQTLDKEQKLLTNCRNKNSVTSTTLKSFQDTCTVTNNYYLTAINQLEICIDYINHEIYKIENTNDAKEY